MAKKTIKINEAQLRKMINESIEGISSQETIEEIMDELNDNSKYYDLAGVEITIEDAELVLEYMSEGFSQDEAIDKVLDGIRETLSAGWDDELYESKTNKSMKKQIITLNEAQLRSMVAESVKKVLKEGNGQFSALYNDKNCPNSYDTKINELLRRYSDLQYEQEQLEKEISKYTDWSWDEFCEYANEKYGLTRQNMDTNWQNFADAEYNKEILNKRKEGSGFSTDGTRAF